MAKGYVISNGNKMAAELVKYSELLECYIVRIGGVELTSDNFTKVYPTPFGKVTIPED